MTIMKVLSFTFFVTFLSIGYSFAPNHNHHHKPTNKKIGFLSPFSSNYNLTFKNDFVLMSALSDAEALLAKARALREQAEEEEHKLHSTLIEKKNCQNVETDNVIQKLFPLNEEKVESDSAIKALAKRIEEHKLSTVMLERVVERLHEREIAARGLEHVEPSNHHDQVQFIRVAKPQQEDLVRVQGLIQRLIDAAEVVDEKYLKREQNHHHVDASHWSRGNLSKVLKEKAHFLGREHEDEFKKRLEEFYEAARKKKDHESYDMY